MSKNNFISSKDVSKLAGVSQATVSYVLTIKNNYFWNRKQIGKYWNANSFTESNIMLTSTLGRKKYRKNWSRLIKKVFNIDQMICPYNITTIHQVTMWHISFKAGMFGNQLLQWHYCRVLWLKHQQTQWKYNMILTFKAHLKFKYSFQFVKNYYIIKFY